MSDTGYNGLKAFGFTVGVTVLIFTTLYIAKRYHPNLFDQDNFSRNYQWYFAGPNDHIETRNDRRGQSLGEKPRMWDVWIASWYPLRLQSESRSEMLRLSEDERRDADYTANDQGRPERGGFLPLSADKVSDADTTVSSPQVTDGNPVKSTYTEIRISTIILMPALLPHTTSPPSTSSPDPASESTYYPPREYALGTSYIPYAPDD